MNILVTGANGQLGNEMRLLAPSRNDRFVFADILEVSGKETSILDITDSEAVIKAVRGNNIDIIVNCAAYTNVDRAETEPELCAAINATAPGILAAAAKEAGALLVHISTDYVFDGRLRDTAYSENDLCCPSSVYGQTKLDGERAITASGCNHVILRTSWLYSGSGKNFVKTMLALFAQKDRISVVSDQIGSPTCASDLAEAVCKVIDDYSACSNRLAYAKNGIYHYSNGGSCSWYEFARKIAEVSGCTSCTILPCSSEEYPSAVTRPAYSVLDKTKVMAVFGAAVPHWEESLIKHLKDIRI